MLKNLPKGQIFLFFALLDLLFFTTLLTVDIGEDIWTWKIYLENDGKTAENRAFWGFKGVCGFVVCLLVYKGVFLRGKLD